MFEWILSSCFLILVVLALRAALGRKISARLRYTLWGLVLLRLLVPVQLFTVPVAGESIPAISSLPEQRLEIEPEYIQPTQPIPEKETNVVTGAAVAGQPMPENTGSRAVQNRYVNTVSPVEFLKILWAIGGMALALILLASNLHFSVCLRRAREPLEDVGCRLPVYRTEGLPSPCLFGVLRPAVYVTARAAESPEMLRHVLAHELTHYRHLDHIWSILRGIALAVHWWNPLVWLAVVYSRRDGELACDEGALKMLDRGERAAYGETLLALVTAEPSPRDLLSCATTMSGEKRSLRERIHRIACEPKQLAGAVIAVTIIAFLTSACAFGRVEEVEPDVDAPQQSEKVYPVDNMPDFGTQPVMSGDRKEGVYTFLLVGTDVGGGNADTIMVASYDTLKQDVSIMSIPRDTAVKDGEGLDRIQWVFPKHSGNMDVLKEDIKALIGFMPDYYIQINLQLCVQLVDLLGGVMFDVPQDMNYDDPYQNLHIHLRKGTQRLDGEQAMGLVRFRRYAEGDIARIAIQQEFIKALLKECLNLENWDKITEYIDLALENVETDMEFASAAWFASNILGLNSGIPALKTEDIHTHTMPGDYWEELVWPVAGIRQSVVLSDSEQVLELINQEFNPYKEEISLSMLDAVTASRLEEENRRLVPPVLPSD